MSAPIHRVGLSLSGGGYRASAFHLGTLRKLSEMGILEKVDIISTISGGSITGAYFALHSNPPEFNTFFNSMKEKILHRSVISRLLLTSTFLLFILFLAVFLFGFFYFLFTSQPVLSLLSIAILVLLLLKFQFRLFPVSRAIEKIYDSFFYEGKKLGDLPDRPLLVIGSTNLQTSRPFTFAKDCMQDSTYSYLVPPVIFNPENFPIARAVMASSCVPFAFTPVPIAAEFFVDPVNANKYHPLLVDGGVYDNQGIHKLVTTGQYQCDTIITSDAGGGETGELTFRNTISLLITSMNVFMARIKKAQMAEDIYQNAATANREIAYFSLGWDAELLIEGFVKNLAAGQITKSVIAAHELRPEWIADPKSYSDQIAEYLKSRIEFDPNKLPTATEKKIARDVPTGLSSLSQSQFDTLVKQAEVLTELQVKLYCPSLIGKYATAFFEIRKAE
ncbi:MAG: hypothetical protein C5B59_10530 [Bacteroidetes bacterium]|nr:MAG: hypothetical protein C5B59_10530 [Bacteroidota bacterium]